MADPNLDKLNFYSGVNYMKRSDKSDNSTIASADVTVEHDFGYVPKFLYYVDLDGDGFLWYSGERVYEYTDSTSGGGTPPPVVDGWIDETNLIFHPSNSTGTRALYWLLYLDYGV